MITQIINLVDFFDGGMDYHKLRETPLNELILIIDDANKINDKRK